MPDVTNARSFTFDDLACRVEGHGVVGTFSVRDNPEAVRSWA